MLAKNCYDLNLCEKMKAESLTKKVAAESLIERMPFCKWRIERLMDEK